MLLNEDVGGRGTRALSRQAGGELTVPVHGTAAVRERAMVEPVEVAEPIAKDDEGAGDEER
jgi:hypothetical protein